MEDMNKAKNNEYYSEIIWKEVECPKCKGKGSIEKFISPNYNYYIDTTATSTTGGYSTIETCNVCNGYKVIRHKVLEFKKYTEFNKFEIMDI